MTTIDALRFASIRKAAVKTRSRATRAPACREILSHLFSVDFGCRVSYESRLPKGSFPSGNLQMTKGEQVLKRAQPLIFLPPSQI